MRSPGTDGSAAVPEPWEALRARLAGLLARREAVLEETATAWAGFARQSGWSPADVEALWEGLTEDLVRHYARRPGPETARQDVVLIMGALRSRILTRLP
jgi:hypothetical protein